MWELDCEEGRAPKNWCFGTVVLEKTLESPLDCKEIKPVSPKGNQLWIFIGKTDADAKTPIFGHLMWRADWLEKTLMLEGLRVGGDGDSRGRDGWMASSTGWTWVWASSGSWWWSGCCGPWGPKESEMTERLNWTERRNQLKVGSVFKAGGLWVSPLELFLSSCRLLSLCGGWWQQGQVKMLMESEEESRKSWEKEAKKDGCVFPQRTAESDLGATGRESLRE